MSAFTKCLLFSFMGLLLAAPASLSAANDPVVKIGVIPRYNPMLIYRFYQPVVDYLSENTPYRFELKLARDYREAVEFLRQGTTPIAFLGDLTFAKACEGFDVVPLVKPLSPTGEPFYHSVVVVRADSPLQTLQDLKGKSFAFGDLHSSSGNLVPRYLLHEQGISVLDLRDYAHLRTHDGVIKAVLKGKFDAGAVKDSIAYHYQDQGLRILAVSKPIPAVPIAVRKDADAKMALTVQTALLALDPDQMLQRELMKGWDAEFSNGFAPAHKEDYQPIFDMLKAIPGGCGIQCH
ncbi:phosphate/phosphite/phosphonate ABC transporter substrate-binding protein [Geoalkalibacter halelectricus]|uniref:phosphate/phosphite/phosphonate ABC transporter substrate-binding protein n=1 Tax=Geoalkalibacter halelectricus TaxID=2847045 RepID=UPI003D1D72D1